MSRYYDVMYVIKTTKPDEVRSMLSEQGHIRTENLAQDDYDKETRVLSIQSDCNLAGGRMPEESHEEFMENLKSVDPEAKAISRWHLAEFTWDDEFGDTDEEDFNQY